MKLKMLISKALIYFLSCLCVVGMMWGRLAGKELAKPVELVFHHWGVTPTEGFEAYAKERGMDVVLQEKAVYTDLVSFFDDMRTDTPDVSIVYNAILLADDKKLIKLLLPIEEGRLQNFGNIDPDVLKIAKTMDVIEGKRYGVPLQAGMQTILYNADQVPLPPESWNVLWAPENQGLVSVFGKGEPEWVPGIALLALGYPAENAYDMDIDPNIDWSKVKRKLFELAQNCGHFYPNFMPDPESIRNMNYVFAKDFTIRSINQSGQNWQISRPKEAVEGWVDDLCLGHHLKDHPEKLKAAYLLIDFILTDGIQKQIYNNSGFAPATSSSKQQLLDEGHNDIRLEPGFYQEVEMIKPFDSRTMNYYRWIWTKAVQNAGKNF